VLEIWRQCVTSALYTPITMDPGFLAVGPFRAGGYIRELRIVLRGERGVALDLAAVVSPTEHATAEQFRAATPIISRSNRQGVAGQPSWYTQAYNYPMGEIVIPLSRRVDAGALHVLIGVQPTEAHEISILATVTVVGYARMGKNGLGVEDGLDR
jgi:hypothetical protein